MKGNPRKPAPGTDWTHVGPDGQARMVDVGAKKISRREAWAVGAVYMQHGTLKKIQANTIQKGDVLGAAKLAGILAAKKTPDLIPLCHPLMLTQVNLFFSVGETPPRIEITAQAKALDRTGVEMEALTAATAAALTIYDMCKSIDRGMVLGPFGLLEKTGGKSGRYKRNSLPVIGR
jgi:cyclic pyranopterin monophosphate synthase